MSNWDVTSPLGTDPINQGDDKIREMKAALQDALNADGGVFPGVAPSTAPVYYPVILKGIDADKPVASVNYPGRMYINETYNRIERVNDAGSAWETIMTFGDSDAIHAANEKAIISALGVVTLDETSNAFLVSGAETITQIAGWSKGLVIIRWVTKRTITYNGASLILKGGVSRVVAAGDISMFRFIGANQVREVTFLGSTLPTQTILTVGSGTYTTPDGVRQLRIRMVGAGAGAGGAGGGAQVDGTDGGDTTINGITAKGGSKGTSDIAGVQAGGAGGTGGAGAASLRVAGQKGGASVTFVGIGGAPSSAPGGSSQLGHGGAMSLTAGNPAVGYGGGGGGAMSNRSGSSAGGGGEYAEQIVSAPAATYAYTVGTKGTGGTGTQAGGNGTDGLIIIDEIY